MDQKSGTAADQSPGEEENEQKAAAAEEEEQQQQPSVACPRCHSFNTKFCYFNNYNVKQPRHFCRECQRYWTAGGSLRNVPVGAGRRRNKGSSSPSIGAEAVAIATPYEPGRLFNSSGSSSSSSGSGSHGRSSGLEGMAVSSSSSSLPPLPALLDPCASAVLSFKQPAMAPILSETAQRSLALLHNLSETQRNFSALAQKHPSELTPQNIAVLQKIHAELTQHNLGAALQKSGAGSSSSEAAAAAAAATQEALQKAFHPQTALETQHRNRPETQRRYPPETQPQRTPFLQQKHPPDMQAHQSTAFLQRRDCSHGGGDVRVSKSFSSTATAETMEKKPDRNVSLDLKLCKDNGKQKMDERLPPSTSFAEDEKTATMHHHHHHHHPHPYPPQLPAAFAKQDLLPSLPGADHDESTCCSSVTAALACSSSGAVSHPATAVAVPASTILPPAGFVNPSPLMFHPWLWPFILNSTGALFAAGIPRIDPSFAAAVSAMALAQSDPTLAARIAAMASLGGAMPCVGGAMPSTGPMASLHGIIASLNGAMPPSNGALHCNGVLASMNGAMPCNGVMASANGAMPSANGVMTSGNGAMPSNGIMASVNGAMSSNGVMASVNGATPSNPQAYQSSTVSSDPALVASDGIRHPSNQASVGSNCIPQAVFALNPSVPQQHHGQASMVQNGAPPAASAAPQLDPALMARIAALASGSMSPIDPSLTAALAAGYLQWQQQAWNPYAWMFPWNLQWNASNSSVNANTNINMNTNIASASTADGASAVSKRPRSPPANEEQISALQSHKLSKTEIEAEAEADNGKRNHGNGLSLASPHTLSSVGASGSFNLLQSNGDLAQKTMVLHQGLEELDQQSKPCNQVQSVVSQEGT